jgi:hypothetical protein
MDETANATAQSAADDKVYARLEKDLTAVKNDVAHLSQQISEAVNAHGAVAQRQAQRGLRKAPADVVSLITGDPIGPARWRTPPITSVTRPQALSRSGLSRRGLSSRDRLEVDS